MKRAFVIGHPIAHSRSPMIHGYWLARYGIAGTYEAIDVEPADLPAFFDRLRAGEFAGGNVTIPHKEMAFSLCDERDPLAAEIGAVNTLVLREGRVFATNTDYLGFLGNLDQAAPGWDNNLEEAVVLGAGGACRAIIVALRARGIGRIHLLNRTREKAEDLAALFGAGISPGTIDAFAERAAGCRLVVNTTAVGMKGSRFDSLALDLLPADALVTDIVYTPLITPLLAEAAGRGLRTVDGLGMLLHQAVPGFEAWFGRRPEVTAELRQRVEGSL